MKPKSTIQKINVLNEKIDFLIEGALDKFADSNHQAVATAQELERRIKRMPKQQIRESELAALGKLITLGMAMCITFLLCVSSTLPWEDIWLVGLLVAFALAVYFTSPLAVDHERSRQELVFAIKMLLLHGVVYAVPLLMGPAVALNMLLGEAVLLGMGVFISFMKHGLMKSISEETN